VSDARYIVVGGRGYIGAKLFGSIPQEFIGIRTSSFSQTGFIHLRLDVSADYLRLPISNGDTVFLTSAISAPDLCANDLKKAWHLNVDSTSNLIEYIISRGGRVIFFSSDNVYGHCPDPFDESRNCNPVGEYGKMKQAVENHFAEDSAFKSIRLSYVFSRDDKFCRYILTCHEECKEADLFHPFYRAVVHRDDVIEGAIALANKWELTPQRFINFGGPGIVSRVDLAKHLKETVVPNLKYKVTEPSADFFMNRPRIIAMNSPIFAGLLGRLPRSISLAVKSEFRKMR
jgi:dTDP-4-dehydrorhamnose reductase